MNYTSLADLTANTPRGYCGQRMRTDIKRKALRRLKLIKGQLNGVTKMVESDRYCVDIITQSSAIKRALTGVEDLVLENHLTTHVRQQMKSGKDKKAIEEVMKIYQLAQKCK